MGNQSAHLSWFSAVNNRRYCWRSRFIRSVCPSVCGWCAVDNLGVIPRRLHKSFMTCDANWGLLRSTWVRMSVDLAGSRVLPVRCYRWTLKVFQRDSLRRRLFKSSKVQRVSAYSEVRRGLVEIQRKSQAGRLVLEVQGRLAWGNIGRKPRVYIRLSCEIWQRKWKVKEHSRRFR